MRGRGSRGTTSDGPVDRGLRTGPAYPEQLSWVGIAVAAVGIVVALYAGRGDSHQLLAEGLAIAVVGRGLALRRPLLVRHLLLAAALLVLARLTGNRGDAAIEQVALVVAALAALWAPPAPPPGTPDQRRRIAALVEATPNDCLAPFAQRLDKSYLFAPDGRAAIAYRVRVGVAVAAGDPLGAPDAQQAAAAEFLTTATANGWRVAVLGAGEGWAPWWREHGLRAVPIGRDVVIDVASFEMSGRAFRNLRQAVQRTHNFGITTEIYDESEMPADLVERLRTMVAASKRNPHRGFSMILDALLEQRHRGTLIAVAFDRDRQVVGFQRFATADHGREISQDLPWRLPGAPNGVDERLAFDMVEWARRNGACRVSLSFAAFPQLFESRPDGALDRLGYWAAHRLDPLIKLESLYRYLRKFHALGRQRFALLRLRDLLPVLVAMLTLEFGARRGRRPVDGGRLRRVLHLGRQAQ